VIRKREEERGDGIDIRAIFRKGLQNPNGVRVVSSKERLDAVRGGALCGYVSGDDENASGQHRKHAHIASDAC
jgi:hypothetical protein